MEYTVYIVVLNENGEEESIPVTLTTRDNLEDAIQFRDDIVTLYAEDRHKE